VLAETVNEQEVFLVRGIVEKDTGGEMGGRSYMTMRWLTVKKKMWMV